MLLQEINIVPLPVEVTEELVLLLVDIGIPRLVTLGHGLGIHLNLSQVLLHLVLFSFQMISLKYPKINPKKLGTKNGDLP